MIQKMKIRPDCIFVIRYDPFIPKSKQLGFYQEALLRETIQGAKIVSVSRDADIDFLVGNVIVEMQPETVVFDFSFLDWCVPYAKNEKAVFKDFLGNTKVYQLTHDIDRYASKIDQEIADATNYFGGISENLLAMANSEFQPRDHPFITPISYSGCFPKSSSKYMSFGGLGQAIYDMAKMGYPKNTKAFFAVRNTQSQQMMISAINQFTSSGCSLLHGYTKSMESDRGQTKNKVEIESQWLEMVDFFGGEKTFHEELRYFLKHDHSMYVYPLNQTSVTLFGSKFTTLADQGVISISLGKAAFNYKHGLITCSPERVARAQNDYLDLCNTGKFAVMGYLPLGEFIDFNRE